MFEVIFAFIYFLSLFITNTGKKEHPKFISFLIFAVYLQQLKQIPKSATTKEHGSSLRTSGSGNTHS